MGRVYYIMSQIVKYVCEALAGAEISCIVIKGEPWFKGRDVATVLGYKNIADAIYNNVPLKFKSKLSYLLKASKVRHGQISDVTDLNSASLKSESSLKASSVGKTPTLDVSELNSSWISEAGLYKLVFKSKVKSAEVFTDWVCSEVLPSIRKTGSYNSNYPYRRDNITNEEVQAFANGREDRLHYDIVEHVKTRYPDAVLQAGLGEHLTTLHARIDATNKGYTSGQPDITILRGLPNGFQDVLAIEFKNPNGKGYLDARQIEYHAKLKGNCNVKTITGHSYEEIIIEIHDHGATNSKTIQGFKKSVKNEVSQRMSLT